MIGGGCPSRLGWAETSTNQAAARLVHGCHLSTPGFVAPVRVQADLDPPRGPGVLIPGRPDVSTSEAMSILYCYHVHMFLSHVGRFADKTSGKREWTDGKVSCLAEVLETIHATIITPAAPSLALIAHFTSTSHSGLVVGAT